MIPITVQESLRLATPLKESRDGGTTAVERKTMGGKPVIFVGAKSVINFKSGFKEKLLCDGLTFSAGSACNFSCSYCYVPAMMAKSPHTSGLNQKHEDIVIRRSNAVEIAVRQLTDLRGNPKFKDPADQRVIYASPLVDVAGNMELVRETIEICKHILSLTHWQIRLLSKSNLLPKVAEGLGGFCASDEAKKRIIYGVSTGTLDDNLCKAIEEKTPLVSKRIESLHWLQENGYRTFGMICPSLPMGFGDPDDAQKYVGFAKIAAEQIRVEKCEHVWAEVINVRGNSFTNTYNSLRRAGFIVESMALDRVSNDKQAWEQYARDTFEAHAKFIPPEKLRFLQYMNKGNSFWWGQRREQGAVLL